MDDNTNGPGQATLVDGRQSSTARHWQRDPVVTSATERQLVGTASYNGTSLSSISSLQYFTICFHIRDPSVLDLALQFDMDKGASTPAYFGRAVFEPYQNGHATVHPGVWESWSPLSGLWWQSKTFSGICSQGDPRHGLHSSPRFQRRVCHGSVLFKAGGNWASFNGNVDAFTIGVSGADTTFDFENSHGRD